jgi:hypothetical protein
MGKFPLIMFAISGIPFVAHSQILPAETNSLAAANNGSTASASQTGRNNQTDIAQTGSGNTATVIQHGSGNRSVVRQSGAGGTVTHEQEGNGREAVTNQSGNAAGQIIIRQTPDK